MTVDDILEPVKQHIAKLERQLGFLEAESQGYFLERNTFRDAHAKLEKTCDVLADTLTERDKQVEDLEYACTHWKSCYESTAQTSQDANKNKADAEKWRNLMADLKRRTEEEPANVHQSPYSNMTYYTTGGY